MQDEAALKRALLSARGMVPTGARWYYLGSRPSPALTGVTPTSNDASRALSGALVWRPSIGCTLRQSWTTRVNGTRSSCSDV